MQLNLKLGRREEFSALSLLQLCNCAQGAAAVILMPCSTECECLAQVGSLAMAVNSKGSSLKGAERSLRLAVGLLTKTLLQNLGALQDHPEFPHLWNRILQVPHASLVRWTSWLHACMRN